MKNSFRERLETVRVGPDYLGTVDFTGIISEDEKEFLHICSLLGIPKEEIIDLKPCVEELGNYSAPAVEVKVREHDYRYTKFIGRRVEGDGPGMKRGQMWEVYKYSITGKFTIILTEFVEPPPLDYPRSMNVTGLY